MRALAFENATVDNVHEALPLLRVQYEEHAITIDEATLLEAAKGLVCVPGRGTIHFARAEGVVGLAVVSYTWTLEHGGKIGWLDELYVVPALRGEGVGTSLLRRAMDAARADGCVAIDLEVDDDHLRASHLYVREGFRPFPRRHYTRRL